MAVYRGIAESIVEIYDFDWQDNIRMKETCICSVEGAIANILNVSLVVLIAIILRISQEAVIFIATFAALRFYAGGAHAKNYVRCISTYLCVLLISVVCAKYSASIQDIWINVFCGFSMITASIINCKYAARQQHLEERTIAYRKKFGRIFAVICTFMLSMCILYPNIKSCSIREGIREVVLIQSFALLAQSIALWIGRSECREGGKALSR